MQHELFPLKHQRGDFLLESLIGMVLMAIIGMGVVFVTSKVSTTQRDMQIQEIAINQMRAELIKNGTGSSNICDGAAPNILMPTGSPLSSQLQGCDGTEAAKVNVTIEGTTVAVPRPVFISVNLETDSQKPAKEVVVGGTWQ